MFDRLVKDPEKEAHLPDASNPLPKEYAASGRHGMEVGTLFRLDEFGNYLNRRGFREQEFSGLHAELRLAQRLH